MSPFSSIHLCWIIKKEEKNPQWPQTFEWKCVVCVCVVCVCGVYVCLILMCNNIIYTFHVFSPDKDQAIISSWHEETVWANSFTFSGLWAGWLISSIFVWNDKARKANISGLEFLYLSLPNTTCPIIHSFVACEDAASIRTYIALIRDLETELVIQSEWDTVWAD